MKEKLYLGLPIRFKIKVSTIYVLILAKQK